MSTEREERHPYRGQPVLAFRMTARIQGAQQPVGVLPLRWEFLRRLLAGFPGEPSWMEWEEPVRALPELHLYQARGGTASDRLGLEEGFRRLHLLAAFSSRGLERDRSVEPVVKTQRRKPEELVLDARRGGQAGTLTWISRHELVRAALLVAPREEVPALLADLARLHPSGFQEVMEAGVEFERASLQVSPPLPPRYFQEFLSSRLAHELLSSPAAAVRESVLRGLSRKPGSR